MRLYKSNTKRVFITFEYEWIWILYILPSLLVNYMSKKENPFTMNIGKNEISYEGAKLSITFSWIIFDIELDYWWNLTEKTYEKDN